jgi:flagellar protein FliO/FliZ
MKLFFMTLLVSVFSVSANAETPSIGPSDIFTGDYLLQVIGSFFLVICILLGVLFFLKRSNNAVSGGLGGMRIISSISLGQRERAVVLQVGEQQLLVGVTAQSIQPLHLLSEPLANNAEKNQISFLDVWKTVTGRQEQEK